MAVELLPVTFPNAGVTLVGHLRRPEGADEETPHPAVVLSTPGSSVKEQIGANYGEALARRGLVTLTFDPSCQGGSGGEPRDLEDPARRIEDLRCALDLLDTSPFVDAERLGMVGICAGGGYAVAAALTDHRVRALGTVVAVDVGRARREAARAAEGVPALLASVAQQRTTEARGGVLRRDPWIPDTPEQALEAGITDGDVLRAVDYYRTSRGRHPGSTNRKLARSDALMAGFDPFGLVPELLTQPLQVVVGGRPASTGSGEDGRRLQELASRARPVHVVDGAGHYELYDDPALVGEAADVLAGFFAEALAAAP